MSNGPGAGGAWSLAVEEPAALTTALLFCVALTDFPKSSKESISVVS